MAYQRRTWIQVWQPRVWARQMKTWRFDWCGWHVAPVKLACSIFAVKFVTWNTNLNLIFVFGAAEIQLITFVIVNTVLIWTWWSWPRPKIGCAIVIIIIIIVIFIIVKSIGMRGRMGWTWWRGPSVFGWKKRWKLRKFRWIFDEGHFEIF